MKTIQLYWSILIFVATSALAHEPIETHTLYGSTTITEPVLIELLQSQALNRLRNINQYGVMKFLKPDEAYTRYEHSIGVLYLLRRYGASLEEQVMGLLHDVSHTAFSHVADFLFNTVQNKYSYQDTLFEWYIEHTDLKEILERHNLLWIANIEVRDQFKMLKDDMPKLCADRLEYNLYGGYLEGIITTDDIQMILDALTYRNSAWVFDSYDAAHRFANVALHLSMHIWSADWNCFIYSETARLLKHAWDSELITLDDLIFSDDATIWHRLLDAAEHDPIIQQQLNRITQYKTAYTLGTPDAHDYITQGKFRWIDPLVMTKTSPQALSTLDREFDKLVHEQKMRFKEPHYIKYVW